MINLRKGDHVKLKDVLMNQRGDLLKVYSTTDEYLTEVKIDKTNEHLGRLNSVCFFGEKIVAYTGHHLCWIEKT